MRTLHGRQLGIVGLGSIGIEVARLAAGLRHACDRDPQARQRAAAQRRRRRASARAPAELLSSSDVVVLSAALTR